MEPSDRNRHAVSLFADLPRTYERMGAMLSFGQDPAWRRHLVREVAERLPQRAAVLDVATGTGAVGRALRDRRPDVRVVGLDQSEPMLRRAAAAAHGSSGEVVLARAETLPFADTTFDGLTFTYLLRYVDDPPATMAELARVVRPGGVVGCLEFHVPSQPWWVPWWVYTRAVMPVVGRAVSPAWNEVGRFLGPSISSFYDHHPLAEQLAWWRAAGLTDVRWRIMSLGGGVVIWGTKDGR
jgi:demethylmenaquinone methyltransferase/2-methoxy-6-polyprenyl-1,4-benzoquinol methylase